MGMTVQFKDQWAADDRLFEASWRAVHGELRRRALRRAKGNLDQGQEWLAATAIKALLFFRRSPERRTMSASIGRPFLNPNDISVSLRSVSSVSA